MQKEILKTAQIIASEEESKKYEYVKIDDQDTIRRCAEMENVEVFYRRRGIDKLSKIYVDEKDGMTYRKSADLKWPIPRGRFILVNKEFADEVTGE